MATYKRIAPWRELMLVFAVCAFPVYSWSIYYFLERMPAWLYYLDSWEVLSIFAYTQVFAFVESLVITLGLLVVAALLPFCFRCHFVAVASVLALLVTVAAVILQFNDDELRALALIPVLLTVGLMGSVIGLLLLVYRQPQVQQRVEALAERLSVLLYLYLPLSLLGLVIVIMRNL